MNEELPLEDDLGVSQPPLGALGDPVDLAYAAVHPSSPAAKFITGIVLPVDGGVSIGF